jgi:AbiV family abortive infection protein
VSCYNDAMDDAAATRKLLLAQKATTEGKVLFTESGRVEEFNRGCDHVAGLLRDSHRLYSAGSFATSVFLSITAIEESAKLEIAGFRSAGKTLSVRNRRDDLLFAHKAKHSIALQEVITIGTRLPAAIGAARLRQLLDMAESGKLVELRESVLYTDNVAGQFVCPAEKIDKQTARDLLLLSLEVWDDRLVGWTSHTYEVDADLVQMFGVVAG